MNVRKCCFVAASVLSLSMVAMPALGQVPDIEVRLIPTLTPGTAPNPNPDPAPNTLAIAPSGSFSVEFWISDVSAGGSAATGIASAYIDLAWNEIPAATADALVTTGNHPSPFTLLAEDGVIDNASNTVTNFGALDGSFSGPGNNTFVLFGWYDFLAGSGLGDILFSATEGQGEIAPFNRTIEPGGVAFIDGTVNVIPEPTSLALLGLGALGVVRRRRRA